MHELKVQRTAKRMVHCCEKFFSALARLFSLALLDCCLTKSAPFSAGLWKHIPIQLDLPRVERRRSPSSDGSADRGTNRLGDMWREWGDLITADDLSYGLSLSLSGRNGTLSEQSNIAKFKRGFAFQKKAGFLQDKPKERPLPFRLSFLMDEWLICREAKSHFEKGFASPTPQMDGR